MHKGKDVIRLRVMSQIPFFAIKKNKPCLFEAHELFLYFLVILPFAIFFFKQGTDICKGNAAMAAEHIKYCLCVDGIDEIVSLKKSYFVLSSEQSQGPCDCIFFLRRLTAEQPEQVFFFQAAVFCQNSNDFV